MEIIGAGTGGERLYSRNLRDLLRMKEEDYFNNLGPNTADGGGGGGERSSGPTIYAVLTAHPPPAEPLQRAQSNRTLLDVIREDRASVDRMEGKLSWRHLTDKIRLRRRGSVPYWSSVDLNPHRSSAPSSPNHDSVFNQASSSTTADVNFQLPNGTGNDGDRSAIAGGDEEAADRDRRTVEPPRMSLMALLAETDRQMGFEDSPYVTVEEDDVGGGAGTGDVEYSNCCVCMVRHKGAAFIPCGHTFCRVCSREVWVKRGNCPLCNNVIVEILDIF